MITLVLANSSPCAPAIRKTLKSPDFEVFLFFAYFPSFGSVILAVPLCVLGSPFCR